MPAKKGTRAEGGADALSDAMERLYGAPLEEFVPLRKELAGALRADGKLPASRLVAGAAKPTRNAWALNQIARHHPELLRALIDARGAAAGAQTRGDAEQVLSSVREYRERLANVVRAARDILARAGVNFGPTQSRRIGESLQAMSAADDDVRAKLLAGRLTKDVETEDPFAGLEIGPPRAHGLTRPAVKEDADSRKRESMAKAAIETARQRLALLEKKAQEARADARKAEVAATHAQAGADRARRAVHDAEEELAHARSALERLSK